ncbi:MAG: glycosyltransferase family 39 protein [Anaerolineae bacterium]|nr:glycosyltransferase family 39 protein [Anaerolineae bacterium]
MVLGSLRRRTWPAAGLILILVGMGGLRFLLDMPATHGVYIRSGQGDQNERAHLWHDAVDFSATPLTWSTYLWQDKTQTQTLALRSSGNVRLEVNGETVFTSRTTKISELEAFEVVFHEGANALTLIYDGPADLNPRTQIGLYTRQWGLWQPINPYRLYLQAPTRADHDSSTRALWGAYLSLLAIFAGLTLILLRVVPAIVTGRALVGLLVLLILALALRLVVLEQRQDHDPAFYNMAWVWDNYVLYSREMLAGNYPLAGAHFQQGNIAYVGAMQFFLGPSIPGLLTWATVFGVFVVGFIFLAARDAFGAAGGWAAGTAAAVYAPLMFYQQSVNIKAPVIWLLSAAVLALVWLVKRGDFWAAAQFGFWVGLASMTRSTVIFVLPVGILAAWWTPFPRRKRVILAALVPICTALTMLPLYLANLQVGLNSPTSNAGGLAFYLNNNRHADGLNGPETDAVLVARERGGHFTDEFKTDVKNYPMRWAQLLLRKFGLLFAAAEHADDNMLNFYQRGTDASPLLNTLYLWGIGNHNFLMGLVIWAGMLLIWASPQHRRVTALIMLITAAYGFGLLGFFVAARGRIPMVVPALVLVGALPLGIRKAGAQRALILLPIVLLFLMGMDWLAAYFPRPITLAGLPERATPVEATFNQQIRLLGYSDFDTNGYVDITLYWEALKKPDRDLTVFLHLLDDELNAVWGRDVRIGDIGFPDFFTSEWDQGTIFAESYYFKLPGTFPDYERLRLVVGIYDGSQGRVDEWPVTDSTRPLIGNSVELLSIAALPAPSSAPEQSLAVFEDELVLVKADWPLRAVSGETISLDLSWYSQKQPEKPYHLFVHIMEGDTYITGRDNLLWPDLPTDLWEEGRYFDGTMELATEIPPGCYELYLGLYPPDESRRLTVHQQNGSESDRLRLGELCVE